MLTDFKIVKVERRGFETRATLRIFEGEMRRVTVKRLPSDRDFIEVEQYVRTKELAQKEITFRDPNVGIDQIRLAGNALLAEDPTRTPVSNEQTFRDGPTAAIRAIDDLKTDTRSVEERVLFNDQEAKT
mgnify:CR=1 FL=1